MRFMAPGMMCLPKSVSDVVEQFDQDLAVENINAHGGEEQFAVVLDAKGRVGTERGSCRESRSVGFLGFLDEASDAVVRHRSA